MQTRNKISYALTLDHFLDTVLVVCPQCGKQGWVKSIDGPPVPIPQPRYRFICSHCGSNREAGKFSPLRATSSHVKPFFKNHILLGAPVDPFFHFPLWLTTACCNEVLWAYNYEHLQFLEGLVAAKLRERNGIENRNQSLGSRLPTWMTAAKNRTGVLKAIALLKSTKTS